MPPDIPEEVLRFLAEKIDSVPQLEALLLLWESKPRAWVCEEIAARIYVRPEACTDILRALERRGMLKVQSASSMSYEYNSAWDEGDALMARVVDAHRRHLVAITTFIHSRASSAVREFARAFDLKKER